jgi:hypothetical protein
MIFTKFNFGVTPTFEAALFVIIIELIGAWADFYFETEQVNSGGNASDS